MTRHEPNSMLSFTLVISIFCCLSSMAIAASPITQPDDLTRSSDEATTLLLLADNGTLIPPVALNTSNIPDINSRIFTTLNLSVTPVHCFSLDQAHPRRRIVYDDYLLALEKIAVMRDAMQSRQWELAPSGMRDWQSGSATIRLGGPLQRTPFAFQIIYIAHLAATIAAECLTPEKGFVGGGLRFGVSDEFAVLIMGRRNPPGQADAANE